MSGIEREHGAPRRPAFVVSMVNLLDRLASACMIVAGAQLVVLIAIFGWLVFGRYVLNDTPTWVEQLSLLLVVWITFLGAATGVWRGTHLGVDFIRDAMPGRVGRFLHAVSLGLMAVFGGFMGWQGYKLAAGTWAREIPMLGVTEGWRAVPLSICGILIVTFSIAQLALLLHKHDKAGAAAGPASGS